MQSQSNFLLLHCPTPNSGIKRVALTTDSSDKWYKISSFLMEIAIKLFCLNKIILSLFPVIFSCCSFSLKSVLFSLSFGLWLWNMGQQFWPLTVKQGSTVLVSGCEARVNSYDLWLWSRGQRVPSLVVRVVSTKSGNALSVGLRIRWPYSLHEGKIPPPEKGMSWIWHKTASHGEAQVLKLWTGTLHYHNSLVHSDLEW